MDPNLGVAGRCDGFVAPDMIGMTMGVQNDVDVRRPDSQVPHIAGQAIDGVWVCTAVDDNALLAFQQIKFHCKAATQPGRNMEDVWRIHFLKSMVCYIIMSGRNVAIDGTANSKATCKKSAIKNGRTPL
jgi:hypothetical protein